MVIPEYQPAHWTPLLSRAIPHGMRPILTFLCSMAATFLLHFEAFDYSLLSPISDGRNSMYKNTD